jgi:hypothetical protein
MCIFRKMGFINVLDFKTLISSIHFRVQSRIPPSIIILNISCRNYDLRNFFRPGLAWELL